MDVKTVQAWRCLKCMGLQETNEAPVMEKTIGYQCGVCGVLYVRKEMAERCCSACSEP